MHLLVGWLNNRSGRISDQSSVFLKARFGVSVRSTVLFCLDRVALLFGDVFFVLSAGLIVDIIFPIVGLAEEKWFAHESGLRQH